MIPSVWFLAQHAAALALVLLLAAAAGTAVAGRHMPLALRSVLGLAVTGQFLILLASFGVLRAEPLEAFGILVLACGLARARGFELPWVPAGLLAALSLPLFVLALYPPVAFDETLYHLPFIRSLAGSGQIRFLADLRFPVFPQLHELLCVPGFLALGDVAPHLVSLVELLLLMALLVEWPARRDAGFLAAAMVVGNPIVIQLGTITYVDMALALLVAAGFYCLDRADSADSAERRPLQGDRRSEPGGAAGAPKTPVQPSATRYLIAAGFCFGSACCVKYLGWYFAGAAALSLLLLDRNRWRAAAIFLIAFAVAVFPMYARIAALSGSPFFPFLPRLFGTTPWTISFPPADAPGVRMLRLLWDVTFARDRLNNQPPYSPLFAIAVLITIILAKDRRTAVRAAIVVGYVAVFAFLLPLDSRYLLPLLPLVSVAASGAVVSWLRGRRSARELVTGLSLLSMAPGIAYAGFRLVRQGPPPLNPAERRSYLERHIPEYRALERRGPGRLYVCGAEQLEYFGGGDLLGDVLGPLSSERIIGSSGSSARLSATLRRLGVRTLLVSRRGCRPEWQRLPSAPEFEQIYADDGAVLWRVRLSSETESW
jgi:4-amino-4-deoxy-L-arabinose transferase-like glycosyltransferase